MANGSTLYTDMFSNIGQVPQKDAQKEIDRLNAQFPNTSWRTDDSKFMYVQDEPHHNPCERIDGFVWVTCTPKS